MTPDEAFDLGYAEGLGDPLDQRRADRVAVILAPHWPALAASEPKAA